MYIFSLILGLAAWVLPVAAMFRRKNYSGWSFALCSLSLVLEIHQTNILVNKPDWSAIEDTYPAVAFAAAVLMSVTVALNVIAAVKNRTK